VAWSTGPYAQPYATYRNGGVPVNQLGQATSGYWLGTEIDWSVLVGDQPWRKMRPAALLQGGHLLPGKNLGIGAVHLFTLQARVRW
jgi:hypothetical protein